MMTPAKRQLTAKYLARICVLAAVLGAGIAVATTPSVAQPDDGGGAGGAGGHGGAGGDGHLPNPPIISGNQVHAPILEHMLHPPITENQVHSVILEHQLHPPGSTPKASPPSAEPSEDQEQSIRSDSDDAG
jgi:hypothetical protein